MKAIVTDKNEEEPPLDVSARIMAELIRRGAQITIFQEFLGGTSQAYRTVVYYKNRRFVSHHKRPFPFVVQTDGRIIYDSLLPNRLSHYDPS